jgi:hypothetical protein
MIPKSIAAGASAALEKLDFSFVFDSLLASSKGSQVSPLAGFGVDLARVEAVFA